MRVLRWVLPRIFWKLILESNTKRSNQVLVANFTFIKRAVIASEAKAFHICNLLWKIYEIRAGLNNLEQSLLQTHLKGYISPSVKALEVVALAVFKLTGNVVGEPLRTSKKITWIIIARQTDFFTRGKLLVALTSEDRRWGFRLPDVLCNMARL